MIKPEFKDEEGDIPTVSPYHHSQTEINIESTDEKNLFDEAKEEMLNNLEKYNKNGSNWIYNEAISLDINTIEYAPQIQLYSHTKSIVAIESDKKHLKS